MLPFVIILWTKIATASDMPGCVRSLADVSTQPIISGLCEIEVQFRNWEQRITVGDGPLNHRIMGRNVSVHWQVALVLHDYDRELAPLCDQIIFPI